MAGDAEKRTSARATDACRIVYRSLDGEAITERKSAASTLNLSASGLCLVADEPLLPDRHVALELTLSDREDPVVAIGCVVWCDRDGDQFRVGVCFTWLRDEDRVDLRTIGEYVARLIGREDDASP